MSMKRKAEYSDLTKANQRVQELEARVRELEREADELGDRVYRIHPDISELPETWREAYFTAQRDKDTLTAQLAENKK